MLRPFLVLIIAVLFTGFVNAQEKQSYTVKKGDTFYSISKLLDATVAELKQWNDITGNELSIGQVLTYYTTSDTTATEAIEEGVADDTSSLVERSSANPNTFYIVKSGDTLTKIAREYDMGIQELRSLNNLSSDNLRIGQRLAVKAVSVAPVVSEFSEESSPQGKFALYTVGNSESLEDVLSKFEMTKTELQALNPDINMDNFELAKRVTVLLPPSRTFDNPYLEKADLEDLGSVNVQVYTDASKGSTTTNGELYNPNKLTAAHSNMSLGSIIFIENPENGRGIYVRVNDRIVGSGLKLSHEAYRILAFDSSKPATVSIYTSNQ